MHIIFGGAFNGKRQYVKEHFADARFSWCEAELPEPGQAAVIAGVEQWIRQQLEKGKSEQAILTAVQQLVDSPGQRIWVLTDISRGIVPIDPFERNWRDVTGRTYQYLFRQADHITRIWYGIPQTIKGDG